jgi:putative FmdB family regulatory protein
MPIYEYQCTACHHHFDTIQGFNDKVLEICPSCQQPTLQKLMSAPCFHLKGTGWYVTDFKKKPKSTESDPKGTETSKQETAKKEGAESKGAENTSSTATKSDASKTGESS